MSVALVAAVVAIVAIIIMLFPAGDTNQRRDKEIVKESIEGVKEISPTTISEETKRSLSERLLGTQGTVLSETTKQSLSERLPSSIPTTITPETAKSLSTR